MTTYMKDVDLFKIDNRSNFDKVLLDHIELKYSGEFLSSIYCIELLFDFVFTLKININDLPHTALTRAYILNSIY